MHFSQQPQHSCHRVLLGAFDLVVHHSCNAETDTCLQPCNPFQFYRIGTRADANIHKEVSITLYLHGCRRMDPRLLLPRIPLSLDTLRPRERVPAVCSGYCARFWFSWRKLHRSPCEHLYRLWKISSDDIFDKDNGTSYHLVSNSWILSPWRIENKSA